MPHSNFTIFIPAGGNGTRLLPFTVKRSKSLVPLVNNFPVSEIILYSLFKNFACDQCIFGSKGIVNYRDMQTYFQGGSGWSAKLQLPTVANFEYQDPNYHDAGSADSAMYNIKYYNLNRDLLVVPNDNIGSPRDLNRFVEFAQTQPHPVSIGLTAVDQVESYGIATLGPDRQTVIRFVEKPQRKLSPISLANTGFYYIKPEAFKFLHGDFGKDTLPVLVQENRVAGFEFRDPWLDFGMAKLHLKSVQSLLTQLPQFFADFLETTYLRVPETTVWVRGKSETSQQLNRDLISAIKAKDIKTIGTVLIGKYCQISSGVTLDNCSVGDFTTIDSETIVSQSNILDAHTLGAGTKIVDSFLGRGGNVGDYVTIKNSFLGDNQTIGTAASVLNSVLAPDFQTPEKETVSDFFPF